MAILQRFGTKPMQTTADVEALEKEPIAGVSTMAAMRPEAFSKKKKIKGTKSGLLMKLGAKPLDA